MADNARPNYDRKLLHELEALARRHGAMTVAMAAVSLTGDDEVEVYLREDGDYGWRLQAGGNHEGIATPGEGYGDKTYAEHAARRATFREPVDRT